MPNQTITTKLPYYRKDAPNEITGEVIYENKYFVTIKTDKGYTETISKRGGNVMRNHDTPEEIEIRKKIKAMGLNLAPSKVVSIPKKTLEGLIAKGLNNTGIAMELNIDGAMVGYLMQYYDLDNVNKNKPQVDKPIEEPILMEGQPPILQTKGRAKAISILVAGVSEYLHELGDLKVEVVVTVKGI